MSACFGYLRGWDGDVAVEVHGAEVLEMNSKSLEVGGAEEHRLLRGALGD